MTSKYVQQLKDSYAPLTEDEEQRLADIQTDASRWRLFFSVTPFVISIATQDPNRPDLDDYVSDLVVSTMTALRSYRSGKGRLVCYLHGCYLTAGLFKVGEIDYVEELDEGIACEESSSLLHEILAFTPNKYKEIIYDHYVLGKSQSEIAKEKNKHKQHINRLIKNALKEIKQQFEIAGYRPSL
jgi:DNA-directed RNA polymerase specialized sigma24 family protein